MSLLYMIHPCTMPCSPPSSFSFWSSSRLSYQNASRAPSVEVRTLYRCHESWPQQERHSGAEGRAWYVDELLRFVSQRSREPESTKRWHSWQKMPMTVGHPFLGTIRVSEVASIGSTQLPWTVKFPRTMFCLDGKPSLLPRWNNQGWTVDGMDGIKYHDNSIVASLMKIGDSNFWHSFASLTCFKPFWISMLLFYILQSTTLITVYIQNPTFPDSPTCPPSWTSLESKASVISLQVQKHLSKVLFSPLVLILEGNSHEMPFNFQSKF